MPDKEYERIYPPSYEDKHNPKCPECLEFMFYVGLTHELRKGEFLQHKLYRCGECRRLYRETVGKLSV